MSISFPDLNNGQLRSIGACWHIAVDDAPSIDSMRGTHIFHNPQQEGVLGRCVVEKGTIKRAKGDVKVVHIHLEIASIQIFRKRVPETNCKIDEVGEHLKKFFDCKKFVSSHVMSQYVIPLPQIPLGSVLSPVILANQESNAPLLVKGTFALTEPHVGTLEFELDPSEETPLAWVTIEAVGAGPILFDELNKLFNRLNPVYDKYVLVTSAGDTDADEVGEEDDE